MADPGSPQSLRQTPLQALHVSLGARMVPFAGYAMPVQYPQGTIAEHQATRTQAGLFDVSHMGQGVVTGPDAARALETLTPADLVSLKPGRQRYALLTSDEGGILDDCMVACLAPDRLFLVVNAANKQADFDRLRAHLPGSVTVEEWPDRALLALQGPAAHDVAARLAPDAASLPFMGVAACAWNGIATLTSRSGYTGEDGFEISVAGSDAPALARLLLDQPEVSPAGLGARDTLRLEAGLCLHGNDIGPDTGPIEAGLAWSIGKRRRSEGGFPGAPRTLAELASGPPRLRVGLRVEDRTPCRAGAVIQTPDGAPVGLVTSGAFAPSLGSPIAMGYVATAHAEPSTLLHILVRGRPIPARISAMPFVPHRYRR